MSKIRTLLVRGHAAAAAAGRAHTRSLHPASLRCQACAYSVLAPSSSSSTSFTFPSLSPSSRTPPSLSASTPPNHHQHQQVRHASKKKTSKAGKKGSSSSSSHDDEIEVEGFPVPVVAKGKKAKAAQTTEADAVEAFHLDKLEQTMDAAVDRLKREMKGVIGRVERLSPSLLDGVRVEEHGQRSPLSSYATVSVYGAEALQVNIFDAASVKAVEKAIRESVDLNLNPQRADEMTLRVPVPRPDMQTRQSLVKKASELAEHARVVIRAARQQGQKDLKADQDNKVVGEGDARKDAKHLTDATKKRTDEVDQIFNKARKVLLDE